MIFVMIFDSYVLVCICIIYTGMFLTLAQLYWIGALLLLFVLIL